MYLKVIHILQIFGNFKLYFGNFISSLRSLLYLCDQLFLLHNYNYEITKIQFAHR